MRLAYLTSSILWLLPLVLQTAIASVMIWRGLAKVFPFFFTYTILVPARDITLLLLPYDSNPYARIFWWGDALIILLSLGVIVEILWHLFRPYPFLRFVFRWVGIVAVIATASALALFRGSGLRGTDRLLESIILMERSARVLQVALLIALISLMSRLGLTWHHYSLGIAAGFGIYSALDLTLLEFRSHFHWATGSAFALLGSAAYNLAVMIWAFYFLRPRGETRVDRLPATDLASWNDVLTQHIGRWYRH